MKNIGLVLCGGSGSVIYTSVEYEGTVKVNGEVRKRTGKGCPVS